MGRFLLFVLLAAAASTACYADDKLEVQGRTWRLRKPYEIGLWGDLPYNDVQASTGMTNLINDMNSYNLAFTVHDGDIKAGKEANKCTDSVYTQFMSILNRLRAPAAYTPGDNEWTDCDRATPPDYNSRERLDYIRSMFFSTKYTNGLRKLEQVVQTEPLCLNNNSQTVACSENRRWSYGGVTYVTLNIPGTCNNLCDQLPDQLEFEARNAANIAWLKAAFQAAKAQNSVAIMIISQANPGFNEKDTLADQTRNATTLIQIGTDPDGYKDYLLALRTEVLAFGKPVAYVHGDSHYARVDKPFYTETGARIVEFTRVETPGDHQEQNNNDVNWIKVTVDPSSREVFSYTFMNAPGNN